MNQLERRIIDISFRHKLSHISSCLNVVNLLNEIYAKRKPNEPVILANCHASLAHFVVLELNGVCDAEVMLRDHGVHAHRDMARGIWSSGGSLGQGETISLGLALADPGRTVWLVTSDGSCMEGATYESFRIAAKFCPNLRIFIVYNGLGAYGKVELHDLPRLHKQVSIEVVDTSRYPSWLRGLDGHYLQLSPEQYQELMA